MGSAVKHNSLLLLPSRKVDITMIDIVRDFFSGRTKGSSVCVNLV